MSRIDTTCAKDDDDAICRREIVGEESCRLGLAALPRESPLGLHGRLVDNNAMNGDLGESPEAVRNA